MGELPEKLQPDFSRDALSQDYMRALYDYWCQARGDVTLPPLAALDPLRLPVAALPYLAVLEVEPSPLRFRSRLTGTRVVEALGVDHTGLYMDEIPGTTEQLQRMAWCVRTRRPYLVDATITFAPHDYKRYQTLALPFSDASLEVRRILFVFAFLEPEDGATPPHRRLGRRR
jgi:hypothetical protein